MHIDCTFVVPHRHRQATADMACLLLQGDYEGQWAVSHFPSRHRGLLHWHDGTSTYLITGHVHPRRPWQATMCKILHLDSVQRAAEHVMKRTCNGTCPNGAGSAAQVPSPLGVWTTEASNRECQLPAGKYACTCAAQIITTSAGQRDDRKCITPEQMLGFGVPWADEGFGTTADLSGALLQNRRHQHRIAKQPLAFGFAGLRVGWRGEKQRPGNRHPGAVRLLEHRVQVWQQLHV